LPLTGKLYAEDLQLSFIERKIIVSNEIKKLKM